MTVAVDVAGWGVVDVDGYAGAGGDVGGAGFVVGFDGEGVGAEGGGGGVP